jgi:tetratricopeptide (TPR) repeat protein
VEVAPEEVTPPVEEAAPAPAEEPFGWTLFEEPQAPPEAITAVEEVPPEAPLELEEEGILPTPVVEEVPGMAEMEVPVPLEAPIVPPEPLLATAPVEPFATERTYLKAHPRDYEGWLALARALWQAGQRDEALEAYSRLIRPGRLLDGVIADLEGYVRQRPDVSLQRVLGDAYMKVGRLQEALSLYRRALETL